MLSEHELGYDRVTLDIIQQTVKFHLDKYDIHNLTTHIYDDPMLNAKIVQIVRRIASEKLEEIEIEATVKVDYPADWWQHFKERWYPKWLQKRFPVGYVSRTETKRTKADVMAFYPKVSLPEHAHYIQFARLKETNIRNW
jgi:hypothetical protein